MNPDLFWVPGPWLGRLAVVARPRGWDWLADEACGWRRANIDVVVSLLEEDEAAQLGLSLEGDAAQTNGIRFIAFPIPDRGVPESIEASRVLLADITSSLESGKNVAVHCRQSVGRSGMIAAGALVASGLSSEKAVEVVSAARGQAIPETLEQLQWVRSLRAEAPLLR